MMILPQILKVTRQRVGLLALPGPHHHLVAVGVAETITVTRWVAVEAVVTSLPVETTTMIKEETATIFVVVLAVIKLAAAILAAAIAALLQAAPMSVEATQTAVIAAALEAVDEGFSHLSECSNSRNERSDRYRHRGDIGNPESLDTTTVTVKYKV